MEWRNIFVVGLDDFNLAQLRRIPGAEAFRFLPLMHRHGIKNGPRFPARELYRHSENALAGFSSTIDAIVGYWDFPVSTLLPLLRRAHGLPGPSLEAVLKCEHKFWSRLEQHKVAPECVPPFAVLDPFDRKAARSPGLAYPFWLKPVKSASSYLGFMVRDQAELDRALGRIRAGVDRFAIPFNWILAQASLPAEIAPVDGYHCIAEGVISRGVQCTLEGYVYAGQVYVYGVVDSLRSGREHSSFARYQYPSSLPGHAKARMVRVTQRFMAAIGFDNSPFNIEFYWDPDTDAIWLLEVNARVSQSHSPLFEMVDGVSHYHVMVELGLGRAPQMPHRGGPFPMAAKFMFRQFDDGVVARAPGPEDYQRLAETFPEALVEVHAHAGMALSKLPDQDSYSYGIADIFLGGANSEELLAKYEQTLQILDFRFDSASVVA